MIPTIATASRSSAGPKPPGTSLDDRIADLTALTVELNFAALIASDAGLPDLAADLCWAARHLRRPNAWSRTSP